MPAIKVPVGLLTDYYIMAAMVAYHLERRDHNKNARRYLRRLATLEKRLGKVFRRNGLTLDNGEL